MQEAGLGMAQEEGLMLELSRTMSYDEVGTALARALHLGDPTCLRFTQQNTFSSTPRNAPLRWRGADTLDQMLSNFMPPADTVFYEVLDIPLPELERLKILTVRPRWLGQAFAKPLSVGLDNDPAVP